MPQDTKSGRGWEQSLLPAGKNLLFPFNGRGGSFAGFGRIDSIWSWRTGERAALQVKRVLVVKLVETGWKNEK